MMSAVVFAVTILLGLSHKVDAVISRNTPVQGFATFYGGPQDGVSPSTPTGGLVAGACGYEALSQAEWPFWNVVAIGPNNPVAYKGNKKGCGYCIQANCTGSGCAANAKPVTLYVTDACESCAPNQLNLNALTFQNNFNTDLTVGRVNVTFQQAFMYEPRSLACETPSTPSMPEGCEWADSFLQTQKFHPYSQRREHAQVDCTPPGNILAKVVKSRNTGGNYIGFALMAIAGEGTITAVDIKGQGDADYQRMANLYGDVWEASLFGPAPLSLRISDNYGRTLVAPNAITSFEFGVYDTKVQFPSLDTPVSPAPQPLGIAPAPAPSSPGLARSFIQTPGGTFCDKQCFASGLTASQFKKIGTQLSTFACGVSDNVVGAVSGYQLSNATGPTCNVAAGSTVEASPSYGCLCQTEAQTQGLQPYNGTSCSAACSMRIDGMQGAAVPADALNSSYVCVPISETSLLNRFGHTVSQGTTTQCLINSGTVATAADQFSCFCLFTANTVASSRRLY